MNLIDIISRSKPVDGQVAQITVLKRQMRRELKREKDLIRREALRDGIERMEIALKGRGKRSV